MNDSNLGALPEKLETFEYEGMKLSCPKQNGLMMIPVKRICELIDVSFPAQDSLLKKHDILSQLYKPAYIVAADNKGREMNCLNVVDMYGWLYTIKDNNRKPHSLKRQNALIALIREKILESDRHQKFLIEARERELEMVKEIKSLDDEVEQQEQELKKLKNRRSYRVRNLKEFRNNILNGQMELPFGEEEE